jgi:predicted DNA-binding transcriptional regulator YafY
MVEQARNIKWGAEKRLEFIDFRLFWEGAINRADIMQTFGVSVPQASKDLSLYQEQAPHNITYDKSEKRYFAAADFKPVFFTPSADAYLSQIRIFSEKNHTENAWLSSASGFDVLPIPNRNVNPHILRRLIQAANAKQALEIKYQSMNPNRPEPVWRWIVPHAFCSDGLRWHVRAFCNIDHKFKDFLISRILETKGSQAADVDATKDLQWHSFFDVTLISNPAYSESLQKTIAQDYGMKHGKITMPVRYALLYYFKKRLRLDVAEALDDPKEAPVVIENREEFEAALKRAQA